MPYIGSTPTTQNFISGTDYFNGTGAQTAFTLTRTVNSVNDIQVVVNNVVQQPNDAYTLSGTTLTFTSAPSSGTNNVYVRYLSTTLQSITPSYGSIIPSMLNPPNTIYWDTSGNVLVNTTTARTGFFNGTNTPRLQVEGTSFDTSSESIVRNSADTSAPFLILGKTRGTTVGSATVVASSDQLGAISFQGSDGTELVEGARILALVDGTPGANDMPGALAFNTTADGASSGTERMRINSSGNVGIGTSSPAKRLAVQNATDSTTVGTNAVMTVQAGSSVNSVAEIGFGYNGWSGTNPLCTIGYQITSNAGVGLGAITFATRNVTTDTAPTERMRIDSSGNVGIGTSSPTDSAGFGRALDLNGSAGAALYTRTNGSATSWTVFGNYGVDGYINNRGAGSIQFYNNNAERMRIHPTGEVSIGSTGLNAKLFVDATNQIAVYGNVNGAQVAGYFLTGGANYAVYAQSSANYGVYGRTTDAGYGGCIGVAGNGTTYGIIGYANAWGLYTNANIYVNGTTYTSDARLKENVQPISNALDKIKQLNPVSFDWKANSSKGITNNNQPLPDYGMIAQEVEQVLPDIVYEVPVPPKPLENNEPDSLEQELGSCKGVDYSRLIPFLTKAIQEQQAMIEELKARIETLEAK